MTEQERFTLSKERGNLYEDTTEEKFKLAGALDLKTYRIKSDLPGGELVGEDRKNWEIQKEYGDFSCLWGSNKKRFYYDASDSRSISKSKIVERRKVDYFIQNINGEDWVFPQNLLQSFARKDWYCKNGRMDLKKIINHPKSSETLAEKLEDYLREMEAENGSKIL